MSMNMDTWLKKMDSKYQEEKKQAGKGGFKNLDDGFYIAKLTNAEINRSQSSDRLQIAWEWTVLVGDDAGQTFRDFDGLEREEAFVWVARKLARFGVEMDRLPQLPAILEKLVERNIVARVQLRTKNDFQNALIKKVYPDGYDPNSDGDEIPESQEEDPTPAEDPTPEETPEEEGVEIAVGMVAKFKSGKKELQGTITDLDEDAGTVDIDVDGKVYAGVDAGSIAIVVEGTDS